MRPSSGNLMQTPPASARGVAFVRAGLLLSLLMSAMPVLAEEFVKPEFTTDVMTQSPLNKPDADAEIPAATEDEDLEVSDPFEGVNRAVFTFNEALDRVLLRPLARTYLLVTPRFAQDGVKNFLGNLFYPKTAVNGLLQGKVDQGVSDVGRFLINLTLGFGGIFDPASEMGFKKNSEDFGQTLGKYGIGPGPYLVLPLLGPANVRDTVGRFADYPFSPLTYTHEPDLELAIGAVGAVSFRAELLQFDRLLEESFDAYAFQREAYTAVRNAAIQR